MADKAEKDPEVQPQVPNIVDPEYSEKRPAMADLTGVKYETGPMVDQHTITVDQLSKLGIEKPQTDLVWSKANDWTVPITDLNAETLDALIALPGYSAV